MIVGKHIFKYCWYIWDKWYDVKNAWINMDGKCVNEEKTGIGQESTPSYPFRINSGESGQEHIYLFIFSTRVDLGSL
jgi:hypothetical protein